MNQEVNSIELFQPHEKQKEIIEACMLTSPYFWITVNAGRRAGKSIMAQNICLYWALSDKESIVWYVCPSDSQAEAVINSIQKALRDSPVVKKINNSKGNRVIEFYNGSKVYFVSALAGDNLRGSKVNYMIVDEAAFMSNTIFNQILMPSMAVGGKKCLIISTPKGMTNWFFEYYMKGLDKRNSKFKSFKFISSDNPFVDKNLIELFRTQVPEAIFNQEYMGIFCDSAAVFSHISEICTLQNEEPIKGKVYVSGIDIGMITDDTVVTILDSNGNMVFQDAFTGHEAPELRERVLMTLRKYKPIKTHFVRLLSSKRFTKEQYLGSDLMTDQARQ